MEKEQQTTPEKQNDKKQFPNLKSFKPYSQLTGEELERQKAIVEKAKQGTKDYHAKKNNMNELAKSLLNQCVSRDKAVAMLGDSIDLLPDGEITISQLLNLCMVRETVDRGNVKAYEAIRDTAGYSPKQQIELTADIITDADRALLDRINSRIG